MGDQKHNWKKVKGYKWAICSRCDLVALKNKVTEKAINKPCIGQYIKVEIPAWMKIKMD